MIRGPKWAPNLKNGPKWRDPKMKQKNVFQDPISSFFAWSQRAFSGDNRLPNQLEVARKIRTLIFFSKFVILWKNRKNPPKKPFFWEKSQKWPKKSKFPQKSPGKRGPLKIRLLRCFIAILTDLEEVYLNILEAVERPRWAPIRISETTFFHDFLDQK